jgi:drug/metabolite transporter (DMT)-like permease
MGAMYFYLQALQTEEASVVSPFFQASPLFAYGLGYLVLGETLTGLQLAGGALIVAGAVLISLRFSDASKFRARLVALMLTCAMALALASLIFKIFAVRDDFWTTAFWTFVGQALFGAGVLIVPASRRQFLSLLRTNTAALLTINGINELVNLAGGLGARFALTLAPLSLVQAVTSTTTLFVFLFGVVISLAFPALGREDLSLPQLAKKGMSAALITIGISLVVG